MWASTGCFKRNSNSFPIANAAQVRLENAISSTDSTDHSTRLYLYVLCETDFALYISVRAITRPSSEVSTFFECRSLYATIRSTSRSSFGIHLHFLVLWAYLMVLFRRLLCLNESCSNIDRATCAIWKVFKCELWLDVFFSCVLHSHGDKPTELCFIGALLDPVQVEAPVDIEHICLLLMCIPVN